MLNVSQLRRCYGDFVAADNVSFSVNKGDIVGLLGHNGAGKTTIMKMLSGYLEPDNGSVSVDGIDLGTEPKQVQKHLGYLPENLPVYPEMTVADYLDYAADLKGLGEAKTAEIKRVVRATDIGNKLLAPIATLSRGYKQRVGVAQAILGKPKLLILDEPTNGLDPEQTQLMRELIREIAQEATVILSTHIMQEVDALCNRVLILRAGQLVVDSTLDDLRQSNHLLVGTSMSMEEFQGIASKIEGVSQIQKNPVTAGLTEFTYHYRITLDSDSDTHTISAQIAQQLIENKAALYQLQLEQRDLETLFREVNSQTEDQEGIRHAA